MATAVDIANLALAHLGDDASIATLDPPEGSPQAEHCARFYPIARDSLLQMHAWGFATRRANPALLESTSTAWPYQYRLPSDCLKVIGVLPDGYFLDAHGDAPFEVESDETGGVLLTQTQSATLRYVARVTDPTKYPALFTEALSWLLASHIAGPMLKGDTGAAAARAAWATFLVWFSRASGMDASQARRRWEHIAPWMRDRGAYVEPYKGADGLYYSPFFGS